MRFLFPSHSLQHVKQSLPLRSSNISLRWLRSSRAGLVSSGMCMMTVCIIQDTIPLLAFHARNHSVSPGACASCILTAQVMWCRSLRTCVLLPLSPVPLKFQLLHANHALLRVHGHGLLRPLLDPCFRRILGLHAFCAAHLSKHQE
jgi:hypothetical protein